MVFAGMLILFFFGPGHSRVPGAPSEAAGTPSRSPDSQPSSTAAAEPPSAVLPPVILQMDGFASWALLDRATGELTGSANLAEAGDTMSLIKSWLAADYLRQLSGPAEKKMLTKLTIMIRDSDNAAANEFYKLNGATAGIERMITICGLTDSRAVARRWSNTVVSARDVARLGLCLADGRGAGPAWTDWLLAEMRAVRGAGDFGPRQAFPRDEAARIAVKNGWLLREEDRMWHISCLAISDRWTMGVLLRYPAKLGFAYGTGQCRSVAQQLFPPASPTATPLRSGEGSS